MAEFRKEFDKPEKHRGTANDTLTHEAWSDQPMILAAHKQRHDSAKQLNANDILSSLHLDKTKYPPTNDPLEERKKLSEPQKLIFDGLKSHDGIMLAKAFNGLPDAEFREELGKVKRIFNEGLAARNIAVGVDMEKVHVYGITPGGNPVQLYARRYDKANDVNMPHDYNDPVQREKILKELQADRAPELKALNPSELELYAGMQKKDGMLIRGALSKMSPETFDEQTSKIAGMFNKNGYSYAIDVDRDEKRVRINWITMQGNPVELYGGPYPPTASAYGARVHEYIRP